MTCGAPESPQVFGYRVCTLGRGELGRAVSRAVLDPAASAPTWAACLNPHSYVVAEGDPAFASALHAADWLLPDGIGLVLAERLLGSARIPARVTGWDLFVQTMAELDAAGGVKVFFLGSTPEVLSRIEARCRRDFPGVHVVGTYAPPRFERVSELDLDDVVARVNARAPHVVWVGLTAPKQELLIHAIGRRCDTRFLGGIGAVFDFYAGTRPRPGELLQALHLEWLGRLAREPRRLWRRTAISSIAFLWYAVGRTFSPR